MSVTPKRRCFEVEKHTNTTMLTRLVGWGNVTLIYVAFLLLIHCSLLTFHISSPSLRARLVRCNGYYTVIGISITRNKRSCNIITITIHLFGDNT
jgi:hypothetical protein